ncbi:tyrosine-protein phosphatase [Lactobacillus helveticus]|uniref:tyrosine-protein phosphatase n=1 Tax=Lactobacillus helveticus TaxID=1587 RepID=UPI0013FD80D7|nr:tyrosine-protein phosphatase [Lactobacillus helveticus]NHL84366.1 tyrosine-protein phosphatase [Lactobacillus helveticus]
MTKKLTNQLIGVTSGRNFRELGGYETLSGKKIKMHKLLRTGNLADLSPFDKQFLTDYGVKYDVDFRSKEEVYNQPDRVPDGVEYIYDPVFSEDLTNSSKSLNDLNKQAANDADFGFGAMLVLSALGVPFSTIKKDYLLTNITTKDFVDSMVEHARQNGRNENVLQSIRDIQSVRPEYLDHAIKVLNDEYGGINNYLRDVMKLSSADIMKLREIYLED